MRTTILFLSFVALSSGTAAAQTATASRPQTAGPARLTLALNGGYQSSSQTFSDTRSDAFFAETATWTGDYRVKGAPVYGAEAGVRLWRNLGAMIAFSRFENTQAATFSGTVPHPFFFERDRAFSGEATGLTRTEQAVHAGLSMMIPAGRRLQVILSAGPSFLTVKQDLAEDIEYAEEYPYDEATYEGAVIRNVSGSTTGFNVGADVGYFFTRAFGLGASVRMTSAQIDMTSPANDSTLSVDAGGMQAGFGLRFRFGR